MSDNGYMEDCIHLKACRRYSKLIKKKYFGFSCSRRCTDDCTAYQSVYELGRCIADELDAVTDSVAYGIPACDIDYDGRGEDCAKRFMDY